MSENTEQYYPDHIRTSVSIAGRLFLRAAEAGARHHPPVCAERWIEMAVEAALRSPAACDETHVYGHHHEKPNKENSMPLTENMGQAILDNLTIEEIEFAEHRNPELSPDQIEPVYSADAPTTLEGLSTLRERCMFASAWHCARKRPGLSAKYSVPSRPSTL